MNVWVHLHLKLFYMFVRLTTIVSASLLPIVKNDLKNLFQHEFTYM